MNKKVLFTIAPAVLVMGALTGCKGKTAATLNSITASLVDATKEYHPDDEITKSDFKVTATYSDNTTKEVTDWTSSDFDSYGEYYFETSGKKTFNFTYQEKTTTLDVTVGAEVDPYWKNYLDFGGTVYPTGYAFIAVAKKQVSPVFPASKEVKIPRKVRGKYITDFEEARTLEDNKLYEVNTVSYGAFESCADIEKVILPVSIETINQNSFAYSSLKEIKFPAKVRSIGYGAFDGCTNLTSITFEDLTHEWYSETNIEKWKPTADGASNVTLVKDGGNSYLDTLNAKAASSTILEGGTTTITCEGQGTDTLYYSSSEESVMTVDENGVVTGVAEGKACIYVTSSSMKNGYVIIEVKFEGPEYAKYMDFDILSGTNVSVKGKSTKKSSQVALNIPKEVDGKWVTGGTEGTTYTVTSVANSGFYDWGFATSVTLPDTITSIGSNAFENCYKISSINLNNNITALNTRTFYACGQLTSLTLPSNLQSIGTYCFANSGLTTLTIPSSVTSIGAYAFGLASFSFKFTSLTFNDTSTAWTISTSPATSWTPSTTASDNATTFKNNVDKTFTKVESLAITVEQTGDSLTYLNPSDYPQNIEKTATTFTFKIKQLPTVAGSSVNVLVLDTGSSKQYSNDFYPDGSLTYELDECDFSKWTGITIRAVYNEE